MQRLISFFVRNHLFGDLLTVVVIGVGLYCVFNIRREVFPNVNFDVVTVVTTYPGASPDEVEDLVTNPIEQGLKGIDGIKKIQSTSIENRSGVNIFLDPDQTTDEKGKRDIQDVIDRLDDLPEEADRPLVTAVQSNLNPIIEITLAGNIPPMELRKAAKEFERELEKLKGVAKIVHKGLRDIEIRVECDVKKLALNQLTLDNVVQALARQNVSISAGTMEARTAGDRDRIVRTTGRFESLEDVKKTVVRANDVGQAITVGEIAKVYYDLEKANLINHTNGIPSLSLTVLKKEKADAVDMVDDVKAKVSEVAPKIDARLEVTYVNDMSYYVRRRLNILLGNFSVGLGMVLLFLPLLIPFRFSMLIALGEPFAFLGTIILLYFTGNSVNLITMIGLIIVSGILVDDSIVVTENAVTLVEKGMDPKEAAIKGTRRIVAPVLASVMTTSMAFLPMAFMSGIMGKFIVQVPIAVITALVVSLFETFFILPGHIAQWITAKSATPPPPSELGFVARFLSKTRRYWDLRIVPTYLKMLKQTVKHRYICLAGLGGLFVVSVLLVVLKMKVVMFPPEGIEIFFIRTHAELGTSLTHHSEILKSLEIVVKDLPKSEVEAFTTNVGIHQQDPADPNTRRGSEYAQITVFLTPENQRSRNAATIIADLKSKIKKPEGIVEMVFNRVNPGPPTGKPVSLGVQGKTYDMILPAAKELKEILAGLPGVTDIQDSYTLGKEEIQVKVNEAEASAANISTLSVGQTVRAAYEGIVATKMREIDEEIKVRVTSSASERTEAQTLSKILVPNPMGALIPLDGVSTLQKSQGLAFHEHYDNQRQVHVTAELDTDVTTATEVNQKIRKLFPELKKKYPDLNIVFGGEDEDTRESFVSLGKAFLLAILGIFFTLVMMFRNLLQPMLVILTIPLGVISVIWTFFLHGMPITFMGSLGTIALAGVIVNNAVIFVDFVNEARANGLDRYESLYAAAGSRVRPIFLTTVTTVIGILPTAYGIGGLDKFVVPIALALGWGLFFGSILTAFVFPSAIAVLDDFQLFLNRTVGSGRLSRKKQTSVLGAK